MVKEKFDNISDGENSLLDGHNRDIDFVSNDSKTKVESLLPIDEEESKNKDIIEYSKPQILDGYDIILSPYSKGKGYILKDKNGNQINSNVFESLTTEINEYKPIVGIDKFPLRLNFLRDNKLLIGKIEGKGLVLLNDKGENLNPEGVYFNYIHSLNNIIIGDMISTGFIFSKSGERLTSLVKLHRFEMISNIAVFNKIHIKGSYMIEINEGRVIRELDKVLYRTPSSILSPQEPYFVSSNEIINGNGEVLYKSILPIIQPYTEGRVFYQLFGIRLSEINMRKFDKRPLLKTF